MSTGRVGWLAAVLVAVVGLLLAVPVLPGSAPVAQLVSFRAVLALGLLGLAGVLLAVPAVRRRALPVVLALALAGGAQTAVLVARAVPRSSTASDDDLVVLSFNTLDVVPAATLAALVTEQDADVVVLPETSRDTALAVADLLARDGRPVQVHTAAGHAPWIAGTALLVSDAVGTYPTSTDLPTRLGGLVAVPTGTSVPTLVAAHPAAPLSRAAMRTWRSETALLADTCASTPGAVVAGDLNSTLDHPGLRDLGPCVDAAREAGQAWRGTWPASAPSVLAAPIDHVLVDGRAWRVTGFDVLAATGGSDHRPVVARLARR